MIDDCLHIAVRGVFAFDDLDLLSAMVCEFFNRFPLCDEGVPVRPDEVWLVMFGFMLWVKDVVGYRLRVVCFFLICHRIGLLVESL